MDGDLAVVTDPENALANPGQWIHVLERDAAGDWSLLQTILRPASLVSSIKFGETIDISGDWIAVGCPIAGVTPGWFATGSVFLYRRGPSGLFSLQTELKADVPYDGDGFGYVQFDGDDLLVSASMMPGPLGPPETGRIFSFSRQGSASNWVQVQSMSPHDLPPVTAELFHEFRVSGNRLIVGQPDYDLASELNIGKLIVYERAAPGQPWVALHAWSRGSHAREGEGLGWNFVLHGHQFVYSYSEMTHWGASTGVRPVRTIDLDPADLNGDGEPDVCQRVGEGYCGPALQNSVGRHARLVGTGSPLASEGSLDLCADGLPPNEFGYLMASSGQGLVAMPGASSGNLCLAGGPDFGRFVTQIQGSGASGTACTQVDWSAVPTALGSIALTAGDTWNFQFWYRATASPRTSRKASASNSNETPQPNRAADAPRLDLMGRSAGTALHGERDRRGGHELPASHEMDLHRSRAAQLERLPVQVL